MDNLERLHTTLNYLCPNGEAQRKLTAVRNEARDDGEADDQIAAYMMGYILDGINYGNW